MRTQKKRLFLFAVILCVLFTSMTFIASAVSGSGSDDDDTVKYYYYDKDNLIPSADEALREYFTPEDEGETAPVIETIAEDRYESCRADVKKNDTRAIIEVSEGEDGIVVNYITNNFDEIPFDCEEVTGTLSYAYNESQITDDMLPEEAFELSTGSLSYENENMNSSNMYSTFWALVPPIIAIGLALITKEVYSSLFIGIVAGGLFYTNFDVVRAFKTIFFGGASADGSLSGGMISKLTDSWNMGILVFLVVLGIMVTLMNRAGGSAAYGEWARRKIKSKRGAQFATFGLGCLIFIDDYFNCLTVGSVMRPVTDKFGISRAKLAYLIDATAAPICIIAPISSWAAAVSGVVEGYNGLDLFLKAIPYNFYALFTIFMIIMITSLKFDFGPMKTHEDNAANGDLYTTPDRPYAMASDEKMTGRGKVIDLILPVIILIICSVIGMIYTGGFFDGVDFMTAFANCDASVGLVYGSVVALLITFIIYIPRRVLSFKEFMGSVADGFKSMVPAILILTFAWTLSGVTGLLGADVYVEGLLKNSAAGLKLMLPAILFLISVGLAFATGTSWGTFGILLPIIVPILDPTSELLIICISSCLAGAVCGDHISPISDTTIMASTGAQSNHINHVSTQLPYALTVAAVAFVCYILAGLIQNAYIVLAIGAVMITAILLILKKIYAKKSKA